MSEFHEELQKITDILDIFTKLPENFGKMLEISGFCEEFPSSVSLFSARSCQGEVPVQNQTPPPREREPDDGWQKDGGGWNRGGWQKRSGGGGGGWDKYALLTFFFG